MMHAFKIPEHLVGDYVFPPATFHLLISQLPYSLPTLPLVHLLSLHLLCPPFLVLSLPFPLSSPAKTCMADAEWHHWGTKTKVWLMGIEGVRMASMKVIRNVHRGCFRFCSLIFTPSPIILADTDGCRWSQRAPSEIPYL